MSVTAAEEVPAPPDQQTSNPPNSAGQRERVVRLTPRWLWLAFTVAALFIFLGTRGLNEPDEGRYAEIGREMAASGDWLVPHLNGFEHFQKPPLLYWLTATSVRLLGANEWAARLPSALAALGTALLVFAMGKKWLGRERASAAVLVLVSSVEFFLLARVLTPDMLLTFWITAAMAALVFRRDWLFFVCLGLGFLTKGPMALVVPISAALGWQLFATREEKLRLPWVRGLTLTLGIGLSWFIALSLWRGELLDYFLRYELVERFASKAHGRSKPFWFFLPVLLGGFLPWTFFVLRAVLPAWRRWRAHGLTATHGLLLGWTLPPLVILSLSGSKLPTYILPLFPALALVVAARLRAPERTWRVAIPAAACWLALAALAPPFNDTLRQQASVRSLAATLAAQPGADGARVFACEVRAHGLEFYLRRLVSATRGQADIVLPPVAAQRARLFDSPKSMEREFSAGAPAFGLVRTHRLGETFPAERWSVLAQAGDFRLIANRSAARDAQPSSSRFPNISR